jgi:hypothetical protein
MRLDLQPPLHSLRRANLPSCGIQGAQSRGFSESGRFRLVNICCVCRRAPLLANQCVSVAAVQGSKCCKLHGDVYIS